MLCPFPCKRGRRESQRVCIAPSTSSPYYKYAKTNEYSPWGGLHVASVYVLININNNSNNKNRNNNHTNDNNNNHNNKIKNNNDNKKNNNNKPSRPKMLKILVLGGPIAIWYGPPPKTNISQFSKNKLIITKVVIVIVILILRLIQYIE